MITQLITPLAYYIFIIYSHCHSDDSSLPAISSIMFVRWRLLLFHELSRACVVFELTNIISLSLSLSLSTIFDIAFCSDSPYHLFVMLCFHLVRFECKRSYDECPSPTLALFSLFAAYYYYYELHILCNCLGYVFSINNTLMCVHLGIDHMSERW